MRPSHRESRVSSRGRPGLPDRLRPCRSAPVGAFSATATAHGGHSLFSPGDAHQPPAPAPPSRPPIGLRRAPGHSRRLRASLRPAPVAALPVLRSPGARCAARGAFRTRGGAASPPASLRVTGTPPASAPPAGGRSRWLASETRPLGRTRRLLASRMARNGLHRSPPHRLPPAARVLARLASPARRRNLLRLRRTPGVPRRPAYVPPGLRPPSCRAGNLSWLGGRCRGYVRRRRARMTRVAGNSTRG